MTHGKMEQEMDRQNRALSAVMWTQLLKKKELSQPFYVPTLQLSPMLIRYRSWPKVQNPWYRRRKWAGLILRDREKSSIIQGEQSTAAASPHWKYTFEVVWASVQDGHEESLWLTQTSLEGLHSPSGLGTPLYSPKWAWWCHWGEGCLGFLPGPQLDKREIMDEWMPFFGHFSLNMTLTSFIFQQLQCSVQLKREFYWGMEDMLSMYIFLENGSGFAYICDSMSKLWMHSEEKWTDSHSFYYKSSNKQSKLRSKSKKKTFKNSKFVLFCFIKET